MQSIGYNDCDLAWAPTGKEKLFNDRPQQCRTSWRRSSSAHARSAVAVVGEAKDEPLAGLELQRCCSCDASEDCS